MFPKSYGRHEEFSFHGRRKSGGWMAHRCSGYIEGLVKVKVADDTDLICNYCWLYDDKINRGLSRKPSQ